jgi:hypothetical protein
MNLSVIQGPFCTQTRQLQCRKNDKDMHTGISFTLGKLYYYVPNWPWLKSHCLVLRQSALAFLTSHLLILSSYHDLTWCMLSVFWLVYSSVLFSLYVPLSCLDYSVFWLLICLHPSDSECPLQAWILVLTCIYLCSPVGNYPLLALILSMS